ncbi:glycosyltransferase [Actinokineospora sp. NBRC 105648]|uniref:glycosyltransferase family 4 protein n=1 Tax=Actinokineospora sp. NBRC 105648 TaxID=3032206 RepID=UPI0024A31021|nr:glycosyltransferase [Actinokineospora sp. NBRC 105648]GLZ37624.1 glycosyl transferase [Actinokineospora sp. NBRC 105648]
MTVENPPITVNVVSESAFTVQGHGVHSAFADSVDALGTLSDLSVVTNGLRQADVTHIHTVGPVSLAALLRANSSVVTAHITADSLVGSVIGGQLLASLFRPYLRWFYNRADVVLSLNGGQVAELRREGVTSEIIVLRTGISPRVLPSRTQARAMLGIGDKECIVLSVGQVQPRKAVNSFHHAATEVPEACFLWVGGFPFGPLTADYRKMRELVRSGPGNVTHLGQLPRATVQLYYAAADVYFHPSHQEHAPISVLEAASAGLPLVLRDIDCYRHLYPGLYLAATDASFTTQIRRLLTKPTLYLEMVRRSGEIASLHSSSQAANELADFYQELIDKRYRASIEA